MMHGQANIKNDKFNSHFSQFRERALKPE